MPAEFDAVIVGCRCAGSAAAIALARRGRKVLALDSAVFPSDTLSTHLFFPNHWAELERLGARRRVAELGSPQHTRGGVGTPGQEVIGAFPSYEGFDYGACVRRPGLDLALVETAREAGVEIRERTRVTALTYDRDRVSGVEYATRGGETGTVSARLVIGADGRHSTVARLVGATAHHSRDNERMMAFAYYRDPHEKLRHLAMQWRRADDLVTIFPCDGGQSVVLLMPPVARAEEFRADPLAAFERTVDRVPQLASRLAGCERATKVRTSYKHPAYFRHSHGPGWALAGDAGHFKDPVTAQGIRDALRFGRLLGEAAAPNLRDNQALDAALAAWEEDRDRQCLPMYQWANLLGRADHISPIENEAYAYFAARPERATELLAVFSRLRDSETVFTVPRLVRWAYSCARHSEVSGKDLMAVLGRDVGRAATAIGEAKLFARRRAASAARAAGPPRSDRTVSDAIAGLGGADRRAHAVKV